MAAHNPAWRTKIPPKRLYLRMMALTNWEKASFWQSASSRQGISFFDLASTNSIDRATGDTGGYVGDLEPNQPDPALSVAALKLQPGEISNVVESNGKYFTLQRMPRNFREDAEAVFDKAMELRCWQAAGIEKRITEALKTYPARFARLSPGLRPCTGMRQPALVLEF